MQATELWRVPEDIPENETGRVVVIGVFDGVHQGHRDLIARARAIADRVAQPLVAVSFDPHPMRLLRPERAPNMLATLDHRVELLGEVGVDAVRLLPFDKDLAAMSPLDFIEQVLVQELSASQVVVGQNFRFGHKAQGTVQTLSQEGVRLGFEVTPVTLKAPADGDQTLAWSSTRIRRMLADGDVAQAAVGLTRPHRVVGEVVTGDQRGRDLGYPTANLAFDPDQYGGAPAIPGDGVYAGWLLVDGQSLPAAISVGTNPTFGEGQDRRVEAYVIDRDDLELYGRQVAVEFDERLRGQVAFHAVEDLVEQMAADVAAAKQILR